MRYVIFFLLLPLFSFSQDIYITKSELASTLTNPYWENTFVSEGDIVVKSSPTIALVKLKKFTGAMLTLKKVGNEYKGRIFKANTVYYELLRDSGKYFFRKLDPKQVVQNCPLPNEPGLNIEVPKSNVDAADRQRSDLELVRQGYACTLYDFDGHTVSGTTWNTGGDIICQPASFFEDEDTMNFIVNVARELYHPFRMVVTRDSTVYLEASSLKRSRIIFSPTCDWYGCGAGGVNFTNSGYWGDETPGFVFTASLFNNLHNITNSGTHEAGHSWGLFHQSRWSLACSLLNEYHTGFGSAQTGFAPTMGIAYSKNRGIWWNGAIPFGCSQFQNDMEKIAHINNSFYPNIGWREIDAGTTSQFSRLLPLAADLQGYLGSGIDSDYFRVTLSEAEYHLTVIPRALRGDTLEAPLWPGVDIYDDNLNWIDSSFNNAVLKVDMVIPGPGTFYIKVRRKRIPDNPTGYGFSGHFTLRLEEMED